MRNIPNKNTGDDLEAVEYNEGGLEELKKTVTATGQILSNIDQEQVLRAMFNVAHPIDSILLMASNVVPPTFGLSGVVWTEQTQAEGHVLIGASTGPIVPVTNELIVGPGATRGTTQRTNKMTLLNLIAHTHGYDKLGEVTESAVGSGAPRSPSVFTLTSSTGTVDPDAMDLLDFKFYGTIVWRRTS